MSIICFIPARGGSKSIPKKNIKDLGGKPLIAYTIETALKCGLRVIVNTDSDEIAAVAREFGAEVMMRPERLAKDTTSMFEVLRSQIPQINPKPDAIMLLQPTSPFRKSVQVRMAIEYLAQNEEYDSLVAVEKVPDKYNPAQVIITTPTGKGMVMGWIKTWFGKKPTKPSLEGVPITDRLTRRQDFPEAWIPTGSIYLFRTKNLKQGSIYGNKTMLLEVDPTTNINEPNDWKDAEDYLIAQGVIKRSNEIVEEIKQELND